MANDQIFESQTGVIIQYVNMIFYYTIVLTDNQIDVQKKIAVINEMTPTFILSK